MSECCPCCGQGVTVVTSDEGTSCYLPLAEQERDTANAHRVEIGEQSARRCAELIQERDAARAELARLEPVALAAIAFRQADKERLARLRGCVVPAAEGEYLRCRTEFRRATDAALAETP